MKKILFFVCTLLCANVLLAQTRFWIGDLQYEITSTNPAEVKVNDANTSITTADIPTTVPYNGTDYSVTSIGQNAFDCSSLTSVTIPNSVTSIGNYAFAYCYDLTSVTIGNSVTSIGDYAFFACNSLTSVTIGNRVTSIGDYAFYDCDGLTSVTIPNSVTSIGNSAFQSCSSLTSIDIPNSVTSIGNRSFQYCSSLTSIDIPNSVTSIGDSAFYYCSSLTSITIPNSVTYIGNEAFRGCSSLTSIDIPNSVTSIGSYTFGYCSSLTSVNIPNSVTSIGDYAFTYCSSLTSIDIPNSVTSIGDYAFSGCGSLTSIDIPNSVTSIGERAFGVCYNLTSVTCLAETAPSLGNNVFSSTPSNKTLSYPCGSDYSSWETATTWASVECTWDLGNGLTYFPLTFAIISEGERIMKVSDCDASATDVEIPARVIYNGELYDVTAIGESAFSWCSSLTSVIIPNSVTSIGEDAFRYCSSLTSVTIPNSVTSIGVAAFFSCSSLTSVTIPNSVTSIGGSAFYNCSSLTSVTIPNSVTSIGYSAFEYCSSLTSVTIPNSVTSIGSGAFRHCISLTSVILPNNANIYSSAFESTGGIKVGFIYYGGKGTVNIGNYTFNNVGFIKFYLNGNATTITPSEVSVIDCDESLSGDIVIPSILSYEGINIAVTSIGQGAFSYCSSLTSVTLPNSVTSIGEDAFRYCRSLTSVTIPNSVTSIGDYAFYWCSSLTSITIPNSVTSIGIWAFYNCSSLTSVTCLAETAPSLGASVFASTPSTKVLNIPFGSDYSSWQGATTWSKTNYLIQEGETKELSNDFTINSTTGLINEGVLRIKQGGQLINQTATNVEGIIEIEAINRANNWNYIGAPFANNYQLGAILPQANDVSVSTFNHSTGSWSSEWATYDDVIYTGESFAAWNWGASPITFTTYGDIWNYETNQAGGYNFEQAPTYTLNNQDKITITHQDNNPSDGVNWLSVANPYTFKLDIAQIRTDNELQGDVLYTYNGETFQPVETGEIAVTEGFFVNNTTLKLKKGQRKTNIAKSTKQKDYIKLIMTDTDTQAELLFTQNDKANANYDRFDANKLFSPKEITEPYFVTDGKALVKEEVKDLPYTATLNIKSYENKDITIKITNIPEGVNVYLLDNGQDTKMNGDVEYTTNITAGENADRFKILFKPQQKLETKQNNHITINNHNRHITITSTITDLHIEVYNTLGQKVHTTKDYTFTLDHLPSGSYLIKAFKGRQTKTEKIVIE